MVSTYGLFIIYNLFINNLFMVSTYGLFIIYNLFINNLFMVYN